MPYHKQDFIHPNIKPAVFSETLFSLYTRLSDVMLTFYLAALFLRLLKTVVGDHFGELTIASEQLHANVLFQG